MAEPFVVVIILNWNRRVDTLECLGSLKQETYPSFEVVVVDNGSSDDSVEAIRVNYPEVKLIVNEVNLGFARGNNLGIQYGLEKKADYILLLNNDTVVAPDLITELVTCMEKDRSIAVSGPKVLYYTDQRRLWSAGGIVNFTENVSRMRGYRQIDRGQYDEIEEVHFISGCTMFLRREAIERIGLLDPLFSPAYFEDLDWCMRARKYGFRCLYYPEAKVYHKVSMSGGGEYNPKERYWLGFNAISFMRRYANINQWIKFLFFAVGSLPFVFLIRVFQKRGQAVMAKGIGIMDGLLGYQRDTYLS